MTGSDRIARERSFRNRFSKTHQGVLGDPSRIDRDGVLGEKAFALYMGIPDTVIEAKKPVAHNFVLEDGTRVDVRASRAMFCKLIVPPAILMRGKVDAFVLVELRDEKGRFSNVDEVVRLDGMVAILQGWATPADLQAVEPVIISQRPGASPVHALQQNQLRDMAELKRKNVMFTRSLFDL